MQGTMRRTVSTSAHVMHNCKVRVLTLSHLQNSTIAQTATQEAAGVDRLAC